MCARRSIATRGSWNSAATCVSERVYSRTLKHEKTKDDRHKWSELQKSVQDGGKKFSSRDKAKRRGKLESVEIPDANIPKVQVAIYIGERNGKKNGCHIDN